MSPDSVYHHHQEKLSLQTIPLLILPTWKRPGTWGLPQERGSCSPSRVLIWSTILPVDLTMSKSHLGLMNRNIVDPSSQVPSSAQTTRWWSSSVVMTMKATIMGSRQPGKLVNQLMEAGDPGAPMDRAGVE